MAKYARQGHHAVIKDKRLLVDGEPARLGCVAVYLNGEECSCIEADERLQRVRVPIKTPSGRPVFDEHHKPMVGWLYGEVKIVLAPDWRRG